MERPTLRSPGRGSFSNDITVVMVVRNECPAMERSVPLILGQEGGLLRRLVVIDSGSSDGTVDLVREFASDDDRLRLVEIEPDEFGHARTRNLGLRLARSRYVVFLGGDAVPLRTDWLAQLSSVVRTGDCAASYGRQIPREDSDFSNAVRMAYNYPAASRIQNSRSGLKGRSLYFFSSVNCCVDREAVAEPFFCESLNVNEDIGLSRRLIEEGGSIAYVGHAGVEHGHNHGPLDMLRRAFDHGVVYSRLGVFGNSEDSSIRGEGWSYLRMGLLKAGIWRLDRIVPFVFFLGASALGLKLGMMARHLPRWVVERVSVYGTH